VGERERKITTSKNTLISISGRFKKATIPSFHWRLA